MIPRPRPALLTAAFVILFAVIANLAWATAITTTGPWYDAGVSLQVYSLAAAVAALLAIVLVTNAARVAGTLGSSMRRVDRRVALLRAKAAPRASRDPLPGAETAFEDSDLDAMTDGLGDRPASALVRVEKEGHDTLVALPAAAAASRTDAATEVLHQLVRERIALREAGARVWAYAAGPVAACLGFLAIAGPMLPGSGPFAAAHYQLNTTLVLFLSYGLAPLVAWAVLALGWTGTVHRAPD